MSITAETAKAHAHDPAVLCCRAEGGITIEPANLEDPAIFDDLVDSGLLNLDGCLTIEEVLGAKLKETCDSLCRSQQTRLRAQRLRPQRQRKHLQRQRLRQHRQQLPRQHRLQQQAAH